MSKRGTRLTAKQKKILSRKGVNPAEYLYWRVVGDNTVFVKKETGEPLVIPTSEMEGR